MQLVPRLGLKQKKRTCLWIFLPIFFTVMTAASTMYSIFLPYNREICYNYPTTGQCQSVTVPLIFALIFIGVLDSLAYQQIQNIALSKGNIRKKRFAYEGSTEFMTNLLIFII